MGAFQIIVAVDQRQTVATTPLAVADRQLTNINIELRLQFTYKKKG